MKLATMLEKIWGKHRYATADDIRNVFGDYHNALHWLALFLIGDEKLADACIVDACTIAQTQTPAFHEWLIHFGARATVRCAFQRQHARIAELTPEYEKSEPVRVELPPLSAEYFRLLVKNTEDIHARLDVLCRFVLVMRGIAKDSFNEVAVQLGISRSAVERAYCVAFDTLELASYEAHRTAMKVDFHGVLAGWSDSCSRPTEMHRADESPNETAVTFKKVLSA
jgi:DNA-directed RNA polymerase specialized sigma24 family protein